ncbi:MAG: type III pantothenate kinase [Lachnoclostridium sp.]|nr:type III pantothenate kinase [Lachnoclostridium sp.]
MLLVIDVGNTNLTFGVYKGEELLCFFRLITGISRTSDEFGININGILAHHGIRTEEIKDVIISSVVPQVMYSLMSGIRKYLKKEPIVVGTGTKTGIRIPAASPSEVGADRIVDAVAGFDLYGGPVIVIDFGTATTYDLIGKDGSFLAGITCPGIKLSASALWTGTARLPEIEIAKPPSILAKNTITSMQAGLVYGTIGQTEYIITKIKEESKLDHIKVVATGGLGRIICESTKMIDVYDPQLTLQGLRLIYAKRGKE